MANKGGLVGSGNTREHARRRLLKAALGVALAGALAGCGTSPAAQPPDGLANATVLIVRHAEKPEHGRDLSPAGYRRARAYARYFNPLVLDGEALRPDALFAASSTLNSRRPVETLKPLAHALGLKINHRYGNRHTRRLAWDLHGAPHGRVILIAWHHGHIPRLIDDLGGDAARLLPRGKWPPAVYDWVVVLRYDNVGRVRSAYVVTEPAALAAR